MKKNKSHLKVNGYYSESPYKTPHKSLNNPLLIERDRWFGNYLLEKLVKVKEHYNLQLLENTNFARDNSVYVEFTSEWGTKLDFDKFDKDGVKKNKVLFQLLKIENEERRVEGKIEFRSTVLVVVNERGITEFIQKIKNFLDPLKDTEKGKFSNQALLNNISNIEIATLKSFWADSPEIPFPNEKENIWWEVWFRKTDNYKDKLAEVSQNLEGVGCQIGVSQIELAEYVVKLVKGSAKQLSSSLLLLDNLAELRKPQEIADFILDKNVTYGDKKAWLEDLQQRTNCKFDENSILVCLLDSGVNNKHPLINPFLPDSHLYTYNSSWGTEDSHPFDGHGTGVAGLALYGDLTDALSSKDKIDIYHGLESFKILFHNKPNDPELYGAIMESAVATPSIDRPTNQRIFCLTVTDHNFRFNGRPSSWSSSIDNLCFGKYSEPQLFIISGGNVYITKREDYPALNETECIHDPAQAYNALTIGTYTRKVKIDISTGYKPLAEYGAMAPSNSTSLLFDKNWSIKPDVVFEGGNLVYDSNGDVTGYNSLDVTSLSKDFNYKKFTNFGDTSGAAGIASKMVAELRTIYPNYWVETIRGLLVHSADWTPQMITGKSKFEVLRTVGYGVPNLQKAMFSANNSLTLIIEREIQPYKFEQSKGQYNEYHLFKLPWPKEALESLEEKNVKLTVTLSYYIEPNPGSRRLATHYAYHSHQLDFDINKRNETEDEFKIRISKPENETKENRPDRKGVEWEIGKNSNSKGSIRKDFITSTGREMSKRNILAVFPKNGWYKNLKRQKKFNEKVRYSLIVSLETEEKEIDLYTPVFNEIEQKVLV
ncbi:S8 family peptidase [Arcicella rigui]|uniref:S8 family peptidase n=1 Tax=Arcicella rigui TaxID=797020 RepID=A0ABU5QC30_9BACT|nr:S8 family peptidase [Arcicella rigui]MEA5140399.1 S8 family peptidase [Arcicella rigui]